MPPRSLRPFALLLASFALVACAGRAVTVTSAPSPLATPDRTRLLLSALAHDSMEGRATGTPGAARAARYIAERMREAGLEPAGDSGFFQRVPVAFRTQQQRMRNGETREVTRPVLLESFADLDTIPPARRLPSVNVVGVLRGSDPSVSNEYVLIGAHYDHEGIGRPLGGDSIYNGADDDASGVVTVLEIARMMASGVRPRRGVVFMAMTGEEVGLLGTNWFIRNPPVPFGQIVADLEFEMVGRSDSLAGGAGRLWLTGFERSTMGESFAAAGLPIVADPRPSQNFFMRSDNIAFARRGIVAHTLSSFGMHREYHTPDDEVELVDFDHMAAVINVAAHAARLLADGPRPEWKPGGRPDP
ncbi:MAG TPA: M28 family peptidase [Gemmatimonadaceae bacterium]|nr:M28 family peptidase [Gemmatimonadaceae bacterium]